MHFPLNVAAHLVLAVSIISGTALAKATSESGVECFKVIFPPLIKVHTDLPYSATLVLPKLLDFQFLAVS